MYQKLVENFRNNPRDVHTVPFVNKDFLWFHVFVINNHLYVEPAHDHSPKSSVKKTRLKEEQCNKILEIYHRRLRGEQVSTEAQQCTYSQVYWYGIFAELNL